MSWKIFVYGTLKRGLSNAHWLEGQRFLAEARTEPCYRMVDCGGYPGMFAVESEGVSIVGEIWEVDDAGKARLDVLEDVAVGLYTLEAVGLLPPHDDASIMTYLYAWSVAGKLDAGTDWQE
jgi:gamma-glutamylaminecyclotransferase